MKVDEKMIEAGLKAYSSSGTHPVVTIRAIFTSMLSAAPTDYAELVERLRIQAHKSPRPKPEQTIERTLCL